MRRDTIQETSRRYLSPAIYDPQDLVVDHAEGIRIRDVDGTEYLDAVGGLGALGTGHAHPDVVEAIRDQAGKVLQHTYFFDNEPRARLLERLAEITPGDLESTFLLNSGSEAVEGAIKLAKKATGNSEIISLRRSFHGRTHAALAATGQRKFSHTFHPYPPGFLKAPAPHYYRHGERFDSEAAYGEWAAEQIRDVIEFDSNDDVAAVLLEPVQGEAGVVVPPDSYFERLTEICEEEDILLITDEVQAGMGRTGRMFSGDHWGLEPDITIVAKSIGSGTPISCFVATEEVASAFESGDHFTTYGGNPLVCAAANATLDVYEEEDLVASAATLGDYARSRLEEFGAAHELVGDVRGKGLILGIELVRDRATKEPAEEAAVAVRERAFDEQHLLVSRTGTEGNVIRLLPPLVISRPDLETILDRLERVIAGVENDLLD